MGNNRKEYMKARTFKLYRPGKKADGISYLEPEVSPLEGCLFSDGSLAVRWLTLNHSTAVWPSLNDFMAVHGHSDYESYIVWDDTGEKYIVEEQDKYVAPTEATQERKEALDE